MKKYKYLSLILAIIIFVSFYISWTIIVLKGYTQNIDNNVFNYFTSIRGEKGNFVYYFFRIMTEFGYTYAIVIGILIILIFNKGNLLSLMLSVGMGLGSLYNELIKMAYCRQRPEESYRWMVEKSYSYPSGHSSVSTILYGSLIILIIKSKMNKKIKIPFITLFIAIPILIYISRLVLSVHWFSDITGGITNGFMFLSISLIIYEIISDKTDFDGFKPFIEKKLNKNKYENA